MTPLRVVRRRRMGLLAGLAAVLFFLGLLSWEARDDAWLLSVGGRAIDVRGAASSAWTEVWRDCRRVRRVDPPEQASKTLETLQALQALREFSPPDSHSARLLRADEWRPSPSTASDARSTWVAVQAEFDTLEPVVVLVRLSARAAHASVDAPVEAPMSAQVISEGVWSSTTRPWEPAWRIRRFLSQRVPQAPQELLDCLDPVPVFSQPPRLG